MEQLIQHESPYVVVMIGWLSGQGMKVAFYLLVYSAIALSVLGHALFSNTHSNPVAIT